LGGLERETSITSQRCFIIDDRGRLSTTADLNVGRQYTTICLDREFEEVYAIGGYHSQHGLLGSFETFSVKARKWKLFGSAQNEQHQRLI